MTTTYASRSSLGQLAFVAAAFVGTVLSFGATTSPAQAASTAFYEVQLAAPLDGAKTQVLNDVAWKCDGATCRGSQGTSRADDCWPTPKAEQATIFQRVRTLCPRPASSPGPLRAPLARPFFLFMTGR